MNLSPSKPHYILFSSSDPVQKTWRFSLCTAQGTPVLEVSDWEPDAQADRLALLPVVLALEALEQPSHITLCTCSRYVQEGIRFGLAEWQANGWQWECFGQMVPVKNRDLWQRVERALRFHRVECRSWRFDPPHKTLLKKNGFPPERTVGAASSALGNSPAGGVRYISGSGSTSSSRSPSGVSCPALPLPEPAETVSRPDPPASEVTKRVSTEVQPCWIPPPACVGSPAEGTFPFSCEGVFLSPSSSRDKGKDDPGSSQPEVRVVLLRAAAGPSAPQGDRDSMGCLAKRGKFSLRTGLPRLLLRAVQKLSPIWKRVFQK